MIQRRILVGIFLGLGMLLGTFELQSPLEGCAPALQPGDRVSIYDEAALIVWNPKERIEHFVRRADFETNAKDFGFLVPTPTQPDLGEVDSHLFRSAEWLTAPRIVYEKKIQTEFGFGKFFGLEKYVSLESMPAPNAMPGSVQVLHEQQVAGFDATILKADDPEALAEWLSAHGYASRPELIAWLKWYVDNQWIITAFKISGNEGGRVHGKSLRMSFQTDRPFYPYREPEDMRQTGGQGSRKLRVYFLSDEKYEGTIGENGTWPTTTEWANEVTGMAQNLTQPLELAEGDPGTKLEGLNYLTEFEDASFPRLGVDEIYFRPAKDKSSAERPPRVRVSIEHRYFPGPWGLVVVGIVAAVGAAVGVRKIFRTPTTIKT